MALGRIALVSIKGIKREIEKEIAGVMSISLEDAIQNGLLELKAYGGTEQRNLPSGYTQLDGIKGDGTAYIDLNLQLTQDDEADVYFTKTDSSVSKNVFGGRTSATANNISFIIASSGNVVLDFNNSDYAPYRSNTAISLNTQYKAVLNKTGRYIYDGDTLIGSNTTACNDTIETPGTYLFDLAGSGLIGGYTGIINRCVIKGKRNLIPCKDPNNEIGMYDTLNGVFYGNVAGSGSFTAGNTAVPTPTAPVDIVSNNGVLKFSKNMANVNAQTALVGYYISAQGVVTADANNRIYQEYIPCKPSTTYTLSMSSSVYYVSISEYSTTEDSGFVVRKAGSTGTNTQLTITTGVNTNYLRFGTNIDRTEVTLEEVLAINWQLEIGATPTPYHEYVEGGIYTNGTTETISSTLSTATAEMLLKVGTYQDEQEILSGDITRNIGVVVFDGTETWKSAITSKFYLDNDYMRNYNSMPTLCTHYEAVLASGTSGVGYGEVGLFASATQGQSSARLVIGDNNYTSVDSFKAYLSQQYQAGTPVIVLYPLIAETTESVTGQTINIPAGDSDIEITQASLNTLELSAKYKALPN